MRKSKFWALFTAFQSGHVGTGLRPTAYWIRPKGCACSASDAYCGCVSNVRSDVVLRYHTGHRLDTSSVPYLGSYLETQRCLAGTIRPRKRKGKISFEMRRLDR